MSLFALHQQAGTVFSASLHHLTMGTEPGSRPGSQPDTLPGAQPDTLDEEQLEQPRLYRVLLHNDDYTSMEFVVHILMDVFRKTGDEATAIMLAVHKRGMGQCGIYPLEIAETKAAEVHRRAREANFPLRCTLEEA